LPGKILLNATRNGSLTLPPSDPPLAGEDSEGGYAEEKVSTRSRCL
jgi:hypothetical protein